MFASQLPDPDFPAHRFVGDGRSPLASLDLGDVMTAFRESGAILVRGASFSVAEFRDFAQSICPVSVFNESPDRKELEDDGAVQSVNLGSDAFPLHPELAREPWRPDACFFACIEPPANQGQTTFCDGTKIVADLPDEIRTQMSGRDLLYMQLATRPVVKYWLGNSFPAPEQLNNPPSECPYGFRQVGSQLVRYFKRPLLAPTRFGDDPAFANFILFARDYLDRQNFPLLDDGSFIPDEWLSAVREAAEENTYDVDWQKGDVLIVDNSRFMHGRRAITDPDNRMIATYFGYLKNAAPMPGEPDRPVWRKESFRPPQAEDANRVSV